MITVIALVVGVVLAFAFLMWTRAQPDGGRLFYAIGLGVTALPYVAFALVGEGSGRSPALETVGVLLYGGAAWLGFEKIRALLALGWAMHPVWDVALHLTGAGAGYTPAWYPWGCVSFDLMVAGAVFAAGASRRADRPPPSRGAARRKRSEPGRSSGVLDRADQARGGWRDPAAE